MPISTPGIRGPCFPSTGVCDCTGESDFGVCFVQVIPSSGRPSWTPWTPCTSWVYTKSSRTARSGSSRIWTSVWWATASLLLCKIILGAFIKLGTSFFGTPYSAVDCACYRNTSCCLIQRIFAKEMRSQAFPFVLPICSVTCWLWWSCAWLTLTHANLLGLQQVILCNYLIISRCCQAVMNETWLLSLVNIPPSPLR